MTQNEQSKSLHDLVASLSIIGTNIKLYYSGNKHAYRPVAVELRKLLCDTRQNQDNSLLPRVLPELTLHPLRGDQSKVDSYTTLYLSGRVYFNGKGKANISFVNEEAKALPINDWLNQKIFDNNTTIQKIIRDVADKEAAHSDKLYTKILSKIKSVMVASSGALCEQTIISIGHYLIRRLAIIYLNKNLVEITKYISNEYGRLGKGVALLDLYEFTTNFNKGLKLDYRLGNAVINLCEEGKRNHILELINNYDPSKGFLLLVLGINTERWLYSQRYFQ